MSPEPFWALQPGEQRQKLKTRYYEYHDARDAINWLQARCEEWGIFRPNVVEARYSNDRIVLRRGDGVTETVARDCSANVLRIVLDHLCRVPSVPTVTDSTQGTENNDGQ